MRALDETHDARLRSWVESANQPTGDHPIQNLPFGVFRRGASEAARVGVAIGDRIVDIVACQREGLFEGTADEAARACAGGTLNGLMALGPAQWSALRRRLSALLRADVAATERARLAPQLVAMADAELLLPAAVGDYTDFYASIHHATNVGRLFRPDNPLLANYKYVPIAYHGRASSLVVSGTAIRRPLGQSREDATAPPQLGPTRRLDYELEVAFWVGCGNALGEPIGIGAAEDHVFGVSLLNDWSARDVQSWEYQPLGPFLSKSFATSVSPWIVTLEALAPYRTPASARPAGDPRPLAHLDSAENREHGGLRLTLEVSLSSARMRASGLAPLRLSRGELADMYWTLAQMVAHHTSNGCNLRPGDLLGSGTVSGPARETRGCLLELSSRGTEPIRLPSGEERSFLEDDDEIVLAGFAERAGFARIGLGECRGRVAPAQPAS